MSESSTEPVVKAAEATWADYLQAALPWTQSLNEVGQYNLFAMLSRYTGADQIVDLLKTITDSRVMTRAALQERLNTEMKAFEGDINSEVAQPEPPLSCGRCGSTVQEGAIEIHNDWHQQFAPSDIGSPVHPIDRLIELEQLNRKLHNGVLPDDSDAPQPEVQPEVQPEAQPEVQPEPFSDEH